MRILQETFRETGDPAGSILPDKLTLQAIGRAETLVSARSLLAVVCGGIAAHHVRSGVSQKILHVELPGVLFDGPRGEGVPEPVGREYWLSEPL